jgi:hypothetical protein
MYFEGNAKIPFSITVGLNDTGIKISCLASVFYGIIDEFIGNEYKSSLPWSNNIVCIKE